MKAYGIHGYFSCLFPDRVISDVHSLTLQLFNTVQEEAGIPVLFQVQIDLLYTILSPFQTIVVLLEPQLLRCSSLAVYSASQPEETGSDYRRWLTSLESSIYKNQSVIKNIRRK